MTDAYGWGLTNTASGRNAFYNMLIVPSASVTVYNHGEISHRAHGGRFRAVTHASLAQAVIWMESQASEKLRKGYRVARGYTRVEIPPELVTKLTSSDRAIADDAAKSAMRTLTQAQPPNPAPTGDPTSGLVSRLRRDIASAGTAPQPAQQAAASPGRFPRLTPVSACTRPNGLDYHPRAIGRHQDVALLRKAHELQQHVLLFGPPGCGKNALTEAAFPDAEIVTGSAELTESDLLGCFVQNPADGTFAWSPGPLTRSIENAVPLFFDEVALVDPRVLSILYPLMDRAGTFRIPMNPTYPSRPVPSGWFLVAAFNPDVPGARMSDALRSRFFHQVEVTTDFALAEQLGVPGSLVTIARNLDKQRRSGLLSASPQMRELLTFAALADTYGEDHALACLVASSPADDRADLLKALKTKYPNATTATLGARYSK